jgi:hypothetical protein
MLLSSCGTDKAQRQVSDSVVNATISVGSSTHEAYNAVVGQNFQNPHLVGSFRASGGSGNDIVVLVMGEADYINWANGHESRVLYNSGQLTTSSFDVGPLQPGKYYIVFNNSFSTFSTKRVAARVDLRYQQ